MNTFKKIMLSVALMSSMTSFAQNCEIQIAARVDDSVGDIPEASRAQLESVLTRLATENGVSKDITFAQFVLTAKIDVLDKHIVAGPPKQFVNNLGVTLYLQDAVTNEKYATTYLEVDGVGQSEIKSFNNAIRNMRPENAKVKSFMESSKSKVLAYFNKNYKRIILEANRKALQEQYDEALAMVAAIPTCSQGGKEATVAGLKIYGNYRDRYGRLLLDQAKKIWAANPTLEGANEAVAILLRIDPEAACQKDVKALLATISKKTKIDTDFEIKKKYGDAVDLEKLRIQAIRDIGIGYAKSRGSNVVVAGGLSPVIVTDGNVRK